MNRTQRLLELVYFLMNAALPVSLEKLRAAFPDYGAENEESSRRKFERDKETLRDLGIVLSLVRDEESDTLGYTIDETETFLPAITFEEDEVLALLLLARVSRRIEHFPLERETDEALRKILYDRQDDPETDFHGGVHVRLPDEAANPNEPEWLRRIYEGIERRKTLYTRYHTFWNDRVNDRAVDPYGLFYEGGRWALVGWCHLRRDRRIFQVERFRDIRVNPRDPSRPDFEIPPDFDVRKMPRRPPWLWEGDEPVEVEIAFSSKVAWQVEKSHGECGRFEMLVDGGGRLTVAATNPDALIAWCLSFGADAWIVRPERLARELVSRVRRMLARHGQGGRR
jgi:proteasome accessory factor B